MHLSLKRRRKKFGVDNFFAGYFWGGSFFVPLLGREKNWSLEEKENGNGKGGERVRKKTWCKEKNTGKYFCGGFFFGLGRIREGGSDQQTKIIPVNRKKKSKCDKTK